MPRHSTQDCYFLYRFRNFSKSGNRKTGSNWGNDVKGYVWAALIAVVVSLAIVRFTHVMNRIAFYSVAS